MVDLSRSSYLIGAGLADTRRVAEVRLNGLKPNLRRRMNQGLLTAQTLKLELQLTKSRQRFEYGDSIYD